MRSVFTLLALSSSAMLLAQYPGSRPAPAKWKPGMDTITIPDAQRILGTLAGPDFRGRNPFVGDFNLAAGWVVKTLTDLGLKPAGDDGSFYHRFTFLRVRAVPEKTFLKTSDGSLNLPFGPQFVVSGAGTGSYESSPITFLNVSKAEDVSRLNLDSFKGQWVLLSKASAENTALRQAINGLRSQMDGSTKFIFPTERAATTMPAAPQYTGIKDFPGAAGPIGSLSLSADAMNQIAKALGAYGFLNASENLSIERTQKTVTIDLTTTGDELPMVNIAAKLEGSDPIMKDEAVAFGSHLDHMGPGRNGTLYGADDNASGCTVNLMIARAMMANPVKPKRTVLFYFWNLEESGLYGSLAYVNRPTFPLKRMVAYLNMDMLGRNEEDARAGITAQENEKMVYPSIVEYNSLDLYNLLVEMNGYIGLWLKKDYEDRTFRTDTGNFVRNNVPTLKAFTGEHPDYHRAGDTPDKINYPKLVNIAKWLYLSAQELASRPGRPKFEMRPFVATPRKQTPPQLDPQLNIF